MTARAETLEKITSLAGEGYKYGFFTDIASVLMLLDKPSNHKPRTSLNSFPALRVEPYVDCDGRASAERSQAPRKIFEGGALWQYKV